MANAAEEALYKAAIAEVRGEETEYERELLHSAPEAWREALLRVLDETNSQIEFRTKVFDDETRFMAQESGEFIMKHGKFLDWKLSVRTFAKHIKTRLLTVDRLCDGRNVDEAEIDKDKAILDFVTSIQTLKEADDPNAPEENFDTAIEALYALLEKYGREDDI